MNREGWEAAAAEHRAQADQLDHDQAGELVCPTCGHEWYSWTGGRLVNAGAKRWTDGDIEMIQCAGCGRNHPAAAALAARWDAR